MSRHPWRSWCRQPTRPVPLTVSRWFWGEPPGQARRSSVHLTPWLLVEAKQPRMAWLYRFGRVRFCHAHRPTVGGSAWVGWRDHEPHGCGDMSLHGWIHGGSRQPTQGGPLPAAPKRPALRPALRSALRLCRPTVGATKHEGISTPPPAHPCGFPTRRSTPRSPDHAGSPGTHRRDHPRTPPGGPCASTRALFRTGSRFPG